MSPPVVVLCEVLVPLLSGSVPDLELDPLTIQINRLDLEVNAYRGEIGKIRAWLVCEKVN